MHHFRVYTENLISAPSFYHKKNLPCGISSKPTAASTSSKDDIDVIDEMDCLIFSRSDRLLLGARICFESQKASYG